MRVRTYTCPCMFAGARECIHNPNEKLRAYKIICVSCVVPMT